MEGDRVHRENFSPNPNNNYNNYRKSLVANVRNVMVLTNQFEIFHNLSQKIFAIYHVNHRENRPVNNYLLRLTQINT